MKPLNRPSQTIFSQGWAQDAIRVTLIALLYFAAHRIAFLFPDTEKILTAVWPAGGIGLAALLLNRRRLWLPILAGMFIAGNAANLMMGRPLFNSFGFMTANVLESLLCAWVIIYWCGEHVTFTRVKEVLVLIFLATVVNACTALIGAGTAWFASLAPFWEFWGTWWVADGLGILIVAPLIVAWVKPHKISLRPQWARILESGLFLILWSVVTWLVFQGKVTNGLFGLHPYLLFVMFAYAALRFSPRGATIAITIMSVILISSKSVSVGPLIWGGDTLRDRVLLAQMFIASITITGYLLNATFAERKQAEDTLRRRTDELTALQAMILDISSPHSLPELLNLIVERAAILLGASSGGLYLTEPQQRKVRCMVSYKTKGDFTGTLLDFGDGAAGTVAETGQPLIIDDYSKWPGRAIVYEEKQPFKAVMSAPMIWHGKVSGVIHLLQDNSSKKFTQEALNILNLFANHAAVAVENTRLFNLLQQELAERKQAEDALRTSQILLAEAQRIGKLGHAEWSAGKNELICSEEMLRIFELPLDGRNISMSTLGARVAPEDRKYLEEIDQKNFAERADLDYEYRINLLDGKVGWIHQQSKISYDENGTPIRMIGVFQDVTERKQVEEKIVTLSLRNQSLLQAASDGIRILDEQGNVEEVNTAFCAMLGYTREEMLHLNVADWDLQWASNELMEKLHEFIDHPAVFETRHRRKDGSVYAVEINSVGVVLNGKKYIYASARDITERKRMEDALQESHARYRRLVENAPDVVYIYSTKRGGIYYSPRVEQILGYTAEYLYTRPMLWNESIHLDDRPRINEIINKAETEKFFDIEYRIHDAHGNWLWLRDRSIAFDIGDDEIMIEGLATNITERKWAEDKIFQLNAELEQRVEERTRELRDAQEQLVRHEKLSVLGQMASSVGHELRNPLAVITSALYYLKLVQPDADEKIKKYLDMIQQEVRTSEKIITDLLDFARIKSVDREAVSVSELIRQTLERFPAPESVNVSIDIPTDLPKVFVDPRQMIQVLGNLTVNACQAMKDGGKLVISAKPSIVNGQSSIVIAVKDTGVGISAENMKKLFEPLFTTKAKGIGLGLVVSKKLIEANGGRIEVSSEAGVGSTFTVWLPTHPQER